MTQVFAGDLQGDLWMIDINADDPGNSRVTRIYRGDPQRPILYAPALAKHPEAPGYLVYFATAAYRATGTTDSLQAIHIDPAAADLRAGPPVTDRQLQTRTLATVSAGTGDDVRVVSDDTPVRYHCARGHPDCGEMQRGWRIVLPACNERINGPPLVRAGRVQLTTSPADGRCITPAASGGSWLLSFDYLHGHDTGTGVFDINGDAVIDRRDTLAAADDRTYPVGMRLPAGRISAPLHVRSGDGNDAVILNPLAPLLAVDTTPDRNVRNDPSPVRADDERPAGSAHTEPPRSTLLSPVMLPVPGPHMRTGRYGWTDIVP